MIINFSQPLHDNLEINLAIMENIIIKTIDNLILYPRNEEEHALDF